MRIASNSLMSINSPLSWFGVPLWCLRSGACRPRRRSRRGSARAGIWSASPSLLNFEVDVLERADRRVLFLGAARQRLELVEVLERLVGREQQLAALVDPLLALLELLPGRLARGCAQRAGREVDPELLRGAEQAVVLRPHLDLAALLAEDGYVEGERLHLFQQHLERLGDRRLG